MKTFAYRGFKTDGASCRGLVEASGVKEAREQLSERGILAERIAPTARKRGVRAGMRAVLYQELSAFLEAGLPLERALESMMRSAVADTERVVAAGLLDRVREGKSLAASLAEVAGSISGFERAVITASEESGALQPMLSRLSTFIESREKTKDRMQGALIYPLIVVAVGICAAIVMLGLLMPRVREMMDGADLPMITRTMIALGNAVALAGIPVLAVLSVLAFLAVGAVRRDRDLRIRWDRRLFRTPVIGKARALGAASRFSGTLSMLLRGGVGLIDSIVLAGQSTGSVWIERLAGQCADRVCHGKRLSAAFAEMIPLAAYITPWSEIGETTGDVAGLMDKAAGRFEEQWERLVDRTLSLLEPALIIVVGGFVLVVVLSVLLPILSMTDVLGG